MNTNGLRARPFFSQLLALAFVPAFFVHNAFTQSIFINHLGYEEQLAKTAVVEYSDQSLAQSSFYLWDQDGVQVFSGTLSPAMQVADWDNKYRYTADFSEFTQSGTFTLQVRTVHSPAFSIQPKNLGTQTLQSVLDFFYGSRANDAHIWRADSNIQLYGTTQYADVRGGWYDASGDISKYLSHLHYANYLNPQQIPMTAWILAEATERIPSFLQSLQLYQSTIEEAAWGADYLVRILDEQGFFYTNVFDGWSGRTDARDICAFEGSSGTKTNEYQAAWREGGGMAIAALAKIAGLGYHSDYFSANEYLQAAQKGFAHLNSGTALYADDGEENIIDDYTALMAATELYKATSHSDYLQAARTRSQNLQNRLHPTGYFIADSDDRPYFHAAEAGLPLLALIEYLQAEPEKSRQLALLPTIQAHAAYLITVTQEVPNPYQYARQHIKTGGTILNGRRTGGTIQSGFFIPHDNESEYWWQGESARLASLAAAAFTAKAYAPQQTQLTNYGIAQLDWILGKNPFNVSFMSGYGRNNPPDYSGLKLEIGHLDGGISNGITGMQTDGSGIQYMPYSVNDWQNWRWVEQWLPHSSWYMMALAALYSEEPVTPLSIGKAKSNTKGNANVRIIQHPHHLQILLAPTTHATHSAGIHANPLFTLYNARGTLLYSTSHKIIPMQTMPTGLYFIRYNQLSVPVIWLQS